MTQRIIRFVVAIAWLGLCAAGCKDDPGSYDLEKGRSPEKKGTVKVVKTPVPWGTKIPCDKLLDPAQVGPAMGKEVTIVDASNTNREAMAVCQVKLAGEPPSAKEQEKKWMENGRVLGVLPGDEICMITFYCAYLFDIDREKDKCKKEGQTVSQDIGDLACVRSIEAGADYRYIYSVYDPDTHCKYLVNPGPSVTEREPVEQCARLAVDQVNPSHLKTN